MHPFLRGVRSSAVLKDRVNECYMIKLKKALKTLPAGVKMPPIIHDIISDAAPVLVSSDSPPKNDIAADADSDDDADFGTIVPVDSKKAVGSNANLVGSNIENPKDNGSMSDDDDGDIFTTSVRTSGDFTMDNGGTIVRDSKVEPAGPSKPGFNTILQQKFVKPVPAAGTPAAEKGFNTVLRERFSKPATQPPPIPPLPSGMVDKSYVDEEIKKLEQRLQEHFAQLLQSEMAKVKGDILLQLTAPPPAGKGNSTGKKDSAKSRKERRRSLVLTPSSIVKGK